MDLLVRYGGVACGKVLMATQGIDAGDPHLPLAALTAEQKQSILREYGEIVTFVCRLLPAIRQLISIPAGMSRMRLPQFFLYTTAGSLIWNILLVSLGAFVGESWGYIAYLAGEYSHVMLIVLGISGVSGLIWIMRDKRRGKI